MLSCVLFSCIFWASLAGATEFVVIVNTNNPVVGEPSQLAAEISQLYLKKKTVFKNHDIPAKVYAPGSESAEFKGFIERVLGMSKSRHDLYWARLRQTDGVAMPMVVESASSRIRRVERNLGGITMVRAGLVENLPANVKILMRY